jgi:hypothetical protein
MNSFFYPYNNYYALFKLLVEVKLHSFNNHGLKSLGKFEFKNKEIAKLIIFLMSKKN